LEQKFDGDIELIKSEINDTMLDFHEIENYYFSNDKLNIPLFPFIFNLDSELYFISDISNDEISLYNENTNKYINVKYNDLYQSLYEFFVLNLRLNEAKSLIERVALSDDILVKNFDKINSAIIYSNKKQYYDSYELLDTVPLDLLDHPLLFLFQIRNFAYMNKAFETRNLLEKFILLFPYYSEGYELLGDIFTKEGNYESALTHYKKSMSIFQNKVISEKIKKCSSLLRNKNENKKLNKDEFFFDISNEEFKNETKIFFRDNEIRQVIEILSSDSKRNVMLVGESGSGKSYLIKYIAQKILKSEVSENLLRKQVKEINFISLLTGSKYRGQFEEKAVKLLKDIKGSKVILVLEDIHLMMSAGAVRGTSLDFINILKPFLRDNSVQVIATTNPEEFKNTVERDNPLLSSFQKVTVNEMTESETKEILNYKAAKLTIKKNIVIPAEIIDEIVKASKINIRNRVLPDSAVMILERCISKSEYKNVLTSDSEPILTYETLSEVLTDVLNLPGSFKSFSMKQRLLNLKDILIEKIKGQDEALEKVIKGITTSKLGFDINDYRPDGVFLFIGPTGVGKTETAVSLAKALYGSEDYLIRLDMSEYLEKYTYSRFIGAAPGYVGYNDTNQLTDKVRQNPSSIILIDEIEKADNQLLNIFLQIFDAGRLTDSKGNVVDFSNTTIIMTSNIGTDLYSKVRAGYQRDPSDITVSRASLDKALKKYFSPEFLNRIDEIIVFSQLERCDINEIIKSQLDIIKERLRKANKELVIENSVFERIAKSGYSREYGARNITREIKLRLLEKIAKISLSEDWEYFDLIYCDIEDDEVVVKLLKSESRLEDKTVEDIKKMGVINA
jgi:ATP-dependent Clp protease ATP-binding subunit ClpC